MLKSMKSYISTIRYYPRNGRKKYYPLGFIIVHANGSVVYVAKEKMKLIKSKLLRYKIEGLRNAWLSLGDLDYLYRYENGNLRFSEPVSGVNLTYKQKSRND